MTTGLSPTLSRWYVVQARSRQAARADANLRRQGFTTYLPRWRVEKVYRSKRVQRVEPLLPSYLFIHLCPNVDDWRPIRSTRGVLRLVSFGGEPAPVDDEVVDEIRQRVGDASVRPALASGERVEITQGAFRGLEAIFHAFDGEERAILFLNMLEQQVRATLPLDSIRSA